MNVKRIVLGFGLLLMCAPGIALGAGKIQLNIVSTGGPCEVKDGGGVRCSNDLYWTAIHYQENNFQEVVSGVGTVDLSKQTIDPVDYSVEPTIIQPGTKLSDSLYAKEFAVMRYTMSGDCSGTVFYNETKFCTITYTNDATSETSPLLIAQRAQQEADKLKVIPVVTTQSVTVEPTPQAVTTPYVTDAPLVVFSADTSVRREQIQRLIINLLNQLISLLQQKAALGL